jgi:DNA polymerase-3 subunit delta'
MKMDLHPWNLPLWRVLGVPGRIQPAALLLSGPRGVGKGDFAIGLAQALLCGQPSVDGYGCGACQACRLYLAGNHPDFRLLQESASDDDAGVEEGTKGRGSGAPRWIRVEQVRNLNELLVLRPHLSRRRVVLINPADRLHASAANALLKTLEEPPSDTHFILVTDSLRRLPATVLSRCVRLQFRLPAAAEAVAWLEAEGATKAELALAQAGFAPLTALRLDTAEHWTRRERLISQVLGSPEFDPILISERMTGEELTLLVGALQRWCHDLLLARTVGAVRYNPDRAQILHQLAARSSLDQLMGFLKDLQATARFLEHPLNARLVAERCLIGYKRALTVLKA